MVLLNTQNKAMNLDRAVYHLAQEAHHSNPLQSRDSIDPLYEFSPTHPLNLPILVRLSSSTPPVHLQRDSPCMHAREKPPAIQLAYSSASSRVPYLG